MSAKHNATAMLATALIVFLTGNAIAQGGPDVFTVANYPVEASGTNAVAAKQQATAQGRRSAFQSLLKRLVPAQSYSLIEQLKKLEPLPYIRSTRVRSEENSRTQYIASLDFSFDQAAIRGLLNQHNVPFVAQAAPQTKLLLLYSAPKTGGTKEMAGTAGWASWRTVWQGLDLANALAPVALVSKPGVLAPDAIAALIAADPAAIGSLGAHYKTAQVVVAEARPMPASKELQVSLAGQDAVGRFSVTTRYRLDEEDFTYSLELAAVIAQGVLESRWKSIKAAPQSGQGAAASLQVLAEFSNLGQWQRQQQALANTPGVRNLQVGSLSGRSASITLGYPGGGPALRTALSQQGLVLENINGFWVLR